MKLAANLHFMYAEVAMLDRVTAAAQSGFRAVESFLLDGIAVSALKERLDDTGVELIHIYARPGDFAAGDRGIAVSEERVDDFRRSIHEAVEDAHQLGCHLISCLIGKMPEAGPKVTASSIVADNLRWAAETCGEAGITVLIEPISNQGTDYALRYTADARMLIDAVESPHLKLLYDVYHAQMLEGNIAETVAENIDVIGHLQVADLPGRHEPGTGELNFDFLFSWIERIGYAGWVGCEYQPSNSTAEGLDWARPFLGERV